MSRCRVCGQVDDALKLLDGIVFRGKLADDEKLPAWRAIKALYRFGVKRDTCEWIVKKLPSMGAFANSGPTVLSYIEDARREVERLRSTEFAAPPKPRQSAG